MREILFRGKRVDSGKWVQGYYVYDDSEQLTEKPRADIVRLHEHPCGFSMLPFEVIPETVGQYTGLTDKNETKIFEGAILKQYGFCYVVSFENGSYVAYETPYNESAILPRMDWGNAVVVGNVHDNPELLKGGAE